MPTQNGVRREQRADFCQPIAPEYFALNCQSSPLIVRKHNPFFINVFPENIVLGSKVFNNFLLLAIDPSSEDEKVQLPGLKNEVHM